MELGGLTLLELLKNLKEVGLAGFLLIALIGFAKRWWVFGWFYDAKTKECDEWKSAALDGTDLLERATDHALRRHRPAR